MSQAPHPPAPPAGLSYAPPYDPSQELDPSSVKPVVVPAADLSKLEFFQEQAARRTLVARVLLLGVIFGMLALNVWATWRNHETLLINIDQARLEQAQVLETTQADLARVEAQLERLTAQVDALRASAAGETPPPVAVASQ